MTTLMTDVRSCSVGLKMINDLKNNVCHEMTMNVKYFISGFI